MLTVGSSAEPLLSGASSTPVIMARHVRKRFGSLEVLKDVSLEAHNHEVVSLLGSSGSGKSTFLRCLNFLEIPASGSIAIDGEEIELRTRSDGSTALANRRQVRHIRSLLGMVFQSFNLWSHMTVLDNVMTVPVHVLGKSRADAKSSAEYYLHKVGLFEKRNSYPAFLSGGEQQRTAIARALAVEPKAILFDEPTSALDPELVGEVLKVINDLAAEGRTMIVVTHEMAFARDISSKVVFLHAGIVEEQGTPSEIFDNARSTRLRSFLSRMHR